MGVAEHLLAAQHAVVAVDDVLTVGQVVEVDHAFLQPLTVGRGSGEAGLDLLVVDDATLCGVDEEHAARLQTALLHHPALGNVEHAHFARKDHEIVARHPVATGAQAIAVEDRTDQRAVGERHACRAVPRLHQRAVVAVEVPLCGIHAVVVLPRLGNHHEHGVRKRTSAEMQDLQHLVERHRVRTAWRADRERALETGNQCALQQRFARAHPVAVALHGVDLAVVGNEAVGVRQRPRREGVGAEAAVHERECGLHALVGQVGIERGEFGRGEHALVDERAARQRRKVGDLLGGQFVFDALAGHEQLAIEVESRGIAPVSDEQLPERGHHRAGGGPQAVGLDRHVAPRDRLEAFFAQDAFDGVDGLVALVLGGGKKGNADSVVADGRQGRPGDGAQEPVGHLDENARAVTRVGLGTRGTSVFHVAQRTDAHLDQFVAGDTLDVGHERHTTCVVFETGVVETVSLGIECVRRHGGPLPMRTIRQREPNGACRSLLGTTLARGGALRLPVYAGSAKADLRFSKLAMTASTWFGLPIRLPMTRRSSANCSAACWV